MYSFDSHRLSTHIKEERDRQKKTGVIEYVQHGKMQHLWKANNIYTKQIGEPYALQPKAN